MAEFEVKLDAAGVQAAFRYLADRASDLTPAMDQIGQMLLGSNALRFEAETDPDGKPWTPLAASTRKKKAKSGHEKMLHETGRLAASPQAKSTSDSVTLGTNLAYAAAQHFGATITRYAHGRKLDLRYVTRPSKADPKVKVRIVQFAAARHRKKWTVNAEVPEHTITIPARRILGISDDDRAEGVAILRRFVALAPP